MCGRTGEASSCCAWDVSAAEDGREGTYMSDRQDVLQRRCTSRRGFDSLYQGISTRGGMTRGGGVGGLTFATGTTTPGRTKRLMSISTASPTGCGAACPSATTMRRRQFARTQVRRPSSPTRSTIGAARPLLAIWRCRDDSSAKYIRQQKQTKTASAAWGGAA